MQSGHAKTKEWVLDYEPEQPREVEPLMGWTSSGDMRQQVRLQFDTAEEAVAYCERQGIAYQVFETTPCDAPGHLVFRQFFVQALRTLDALSVRHLAGTSASRARLEPQNAAEHGERDRRHRGHRCDHQEERGLRQARSRSRRDSRRGCRPAASSRTTRPSASSACAPARSRPPVRARSARDRVRRAWRWRNSRPARTGLPCRRRSPPPPSTDRPRSGRRSRTPSCAAPSGSRCRRACAVHSRTRNGVSTKIISGLSDRNQTAGISPCQNQRFTLRSVKSSAQSRMVMACWSKAAQKNSTAAAMAKSATHVAALIRIERDASALLPCAARD